MYCSACGEEIDAGAAYCPACGEPTSDPPTADEGREDGDDGEGAGIERGEDYDIFMSLQDGNERTKVIRVVADVIAIFGTGGIWLGILAAEYIYHHYQLKRGEREPFDPDKHEQEWFLWNVDDDTDDEHGEPAGWI